MSASKAPTFDKLVLICDASPDVLVDHLAGLSLPRRALSLPVECDPTAGLPNFVELWGETSRLRAVLSDWPHPARAWRVRENVPIRYQRSWPSGEASPGLRMVSTLQRRPDLSRAAFETHWLGPHVEVAKGYTVPVWHYVQNVVLEALTPADATCFAEHAEVDGFVGMHFRTATALRARWQDHPDETARGAQDAAHFMDVARSVGITATETVWDDVEQPDTRT